MGSVSSSGDHASSTLTGPERASLLVLALSRSDGLFHSNIGVGVGEIVNRSYTSKTGTALTVGNVLLLEGRGKERSVRRRIITLCVTERGEVDSLSGAEGALHLGDKDDVHEVTDVHDQEIETLNAEQHLIRDEDDQTGQAEEGENEIAKEDVATNLDGLCGDHGTNSWDDQRAEEASTTSEPREKRKPHNTANTKINVVATMSDRGETDQHDGSRRAEGHKRGSGNILLQTQLHAHHFQTRDEEIASNLLMREQFKMARSGGKSYRTNRGSLPKQRPTSTGRSSQGRDSECLQGTSNALTREACNVPRLQQLPYYQLLPTSSETDSVR